VRTLNFLLLLLVFVLSCARAEKLKIIRPMTYSGMADASGGVALTTNLFAVVDDEDDILRIYRADQEGPPVKQLDCTGFLASSRGSSEADLEGAARIGDRAFWIGSHGRNKKGKERPNRGCFFATDIKVQGADAELVLVGKPYKSLLTDFISDPRFARFHLAGAARRAPKESDALNIEGLSATPDGHLLIGFRNPIPDGKALLVPLLNPNEIIKGAPARLGDPIQLDLHGLGIRDIALCGNTYLIIGGSYRGGGNFELFKWNGTDPAPEPLKVKHLNRYHPEGLIIYPDKGLHEFQVVSDDGTEPVDGVPGKEVKDTAKKTFRSFWVGEKASDADSD